MLPPGEFHSSLQSSEPVLALLIIPSSKKFLVAEVTLTSLVFLKFPLQNFHLSLDSRQVRIQFASATTYHSGVAIR